MADDVRVVFNPSGLRGRFPAGTGLLEAARRLGVDLDSVCGGRGICGRCQIVVGEGRFAKHDLVSSAAHLSPLAEAERRYDARSGLAPGRRLACHTRLVGDLVVDVPPESQIHKQLVRKRPEARPIQLDPVIRLCYVEVGKPALEAPCGQLQRLEIALDREWNLKGLRSDLRVLHDLDSALSAGDYAVTVAVREEARLVRVQAGFNDRVFGLAVDVGSTTIAAHLCELSSGEVVASSGAMNPQIRFGEDLMSRVSYVQLNPGGDAEMTRLVREAINALARETAAGAGIAPQDILEVTFVGNPIMHHLLLGLDPTPLGQAPFALVTDAALTLRAAEIGIDVNPGARAYVLPCIAGHVGADAAGVLLSEQPHRAREITLVVDVGTNAELVLGNRERLLAASSPTGPAFEGAQIGCGQRAAPGAIERVRIDPATLEPRFKLIGAEAWSDDPGFAGAPSGLCGSAIIEAIAEMYLAGLVSAEGVIDGARAATSPRVEPDGRTFRYLLHAGDPALFITQADVRAIQLAKAALYAGARVLMDEMGIERVERIVLAGAFGSQIDVKYAMTLGMIPDCDLARVSSAGNAAGTGARIALLNRQSRAEIEELVRRVEKVETAARPRFQQHFIEAMAIPHASAEFPNLARVVALPEAPRRGVRARRRPRRVVNPGRG